MICQLAESQSDILINSISTEESILCILWCMLDINIFFLFVILNFFMCFSLVQRKLMLLHYLLSHYDLVFFVFQINRAAGIVRHPQTQRTEPKCWNRLSLGHKPF
jgi:hypothetical protein